MKNLIFILPLFLLPSCKETDVLTPEENARVERLELEIEALQKQADSKEADIKTAYEAALKSKSAEELAQHMKEIEIAQAAFNLSATEWQEKVNEQKAITDGAVARVTDPFKQFANMLPGGQFTATGIQMLIASLLFKRSRQHVLTSAKNVGKGALGDALLSLMKALGWKNTEETKITKNTVLP